MENDGNVGKTSDDTPSASGSPGVEDSPTASTVPERMGNCRVHLHPPGPSYKGTEYSKQCVSEIELACINKLKHLE